ncbi:FadR family transcriptional regulator [Rhizobiaceae bacterium CRRU44]|uniref:FadR family transcriptional regulator n=1 Tax=Ferranicluibacter rubi TaxID=2715133 RepID=A0AA43ZKH8_9HYPH|nr:FadR/GntR family transcriptional regulator [Ferranicluibacter rubi]NHT78532.1 FadR family transcriptional regulator [Ferranicluibacter rubi]TCQ00637.1 GntR family transcriptional regulator [Rhizobium sp. PP-F2F-G36]
MKTVSNRRPRLAQGVIDELKRQIGAGTLSSGAQLPTEPQLERQFSVSRTVVREAIAELRAAGLVTPIQGKGMFVMDTASRTSVTLTPIELESVPQTLELIEFRMGVEVEAAGIAAYRRSASQEEAIRLAHQEMARKIDAGDPTVEIDFLFHRAIAAATNNRYFAEALDRYGQRSIPRGQFPTLPDAGSRTYLTGVLAEHERVLDAISDQDPEMARVAMRDHLVASQKRYRRLAR